jgi:hypothetical protein
MDGGLTRPSAGSQQGTADWRRDDEWTTGCEVNGDLPGVGSGLQFLYLAIDQFFCVLRITSGEWSQSDGSTTLWDDHKVEPHHQEGLHRDVVDVGKGNGCHSSLTRVLGANELDTVPEDPQTLVAYGR